MVHAQGERELPITENNMALIHYNRGEETAALELLSKSYRDTVAAVGVTHPDTKRIKEHLRLAFRAGGKGESDFAAWSAALLNKPI